MGWTLLYILGVVAVFLAIANFKKYLLEGIAEQAANAEERWPLPLDMWMAIVVHSCAEIILFVLICAVRSVHLMVVLPSVIKEVQEEFKNKKQLRKRAP